MKKSLVIVLMALVSASSAFAQFSWNAKAGINMSSWTDLDGSDARLGYRLGVGGEYAFSPLFALQSSLLVSSKGMKFEEGDGSLKVNQTYLELPVMAAVKFNVGKNLKLIVNAGPYMAYGIGGKIKEEMSAREANSHEMDAFGDDGVLERFDFGLEAGVGLEMGKFILSFEVQQGLKDLVKEGKSDKKGQELDVTNCKNQNLSLTLGYRF